MFDAFETRDFRVGELTLRGRVGGAGPALLLLHGHPQTHAMWHRVADDLARRFAVVALDLRGYGDSARPASDARHVTYSKRAMAQHDRGARVAHRLALDHAARVRRVMLLDIAPTLAMYERTTEAFARAYWHWFFLIQPPPLPERLIESDPAGYVRSVMGARHAGLAPFDAAALAEYERCIAHPGSAHAICEDYRAAATIDLEHDRADRETGARVESPLRVLWGAHGTVGRCFDVLALWRDAAVRVDGRAIDCGHYIAEEDPVALRAEMTRFFGA
jgi:haloacetate dehalogenase